MTDKMAEMMKNMAGKRKPKMLGKKRKSSKKCRKCNGDDLISTTNGIVKTGAHVMMGAALLGAIGGALNKD